MIDLVPSDVVASFLLVAALQRANRGAALKSVLSNALLSEEGVSAEALAHPSQQSPAATLDSGEQPYTVCAVPAPAATECRRAKQTRTRMENRFRTRHHGAGSTVHRHSSQDLKKQSVRQKMLADHG